MKNVRKTIRSLLKEASEFRELDSPLTYTKFNDVKRIAYCDSNITEFPSGSSTYFKRQEKWARYGSSGKRLKKRKLDKIIPGVSDVCITGFLDYHENYKLQSGGTSWYIDYINVRDDTRGQGTASKLLEQFYETIVQPGDEVSFGKMMRKEIGYLKDKMVKKYPDVASIGARNY